MVKNLPAVKEMPETQVRSLGQVDPLEEEMATHSSILVWKNPMDRGLAGNSPWGHMESDMMEHRHAHRPPEINRCAEESSVLTCV